MGKKSNQKILMKLIKDIKKALESELNYLKKAIKIYENGVDHSRREGNNGLANYYLVERTQTENRQQILTACKFSIKRLISQSKNYSTFPTKKLGRILSIL